MTGDTHGATDAGRPLVARSRRPRGSRAVLSSSDRCGRAWPGVAARRDAVASRGRRPVPEPPRRSCSRRPTSSTSTSTATGRSFDVPLDPIGTDFQQTGVGGAADDSVRRDDHLRRAGRASRRSAQGHGRSVRRTAATRSRSSCRATGWSARTGALTGFAGGLDVKAWLLDHERFASPPDDARRA